MRTVGVSQVAVSVTTLLQSVCGESGEMHLDVAVPGKNDFSPLWKPTAPSMFIATKDIMC